MLEFGRFRAISFDCYGTLIDWETGILAALRTVLDRHGIASSDNRLLELFALAESEAERQPYRPYKEVLRRVMRRLAGELGFTPSAAEEECLVESVPQWTPFPDAVQALRQLKTRFRLLVISNIDDDLFQATGRHLGVEFDIVTTAEQVRSYKPETAHFTATLDRLALPPETLLHVAQSLFHDIAPARRLGLSTVWVNRRAGKTGAGATPAATARPDLEVPDLQTLTSLIFPVY